MITVDLLEPKPNKLEESLALLQSDIFPLYVKHWQEELEPHYHKDFEPHLQLFIDMWVRGGMKIFVAYENGHAVGFVIGILFRPLQYTASVLQIQDSYTDNRSDVADAFNKYISNALRILGCNEVWYDTQYRNDCIRLAGEWIEQEEMRIRRFVKDA